MKTKDKILLDSGLDTWLLSPNDRIAISKSMRVYADQECAAMTDKLREAEERIAEIKKVYYLINNGNLNQEGLTLYHAIGEIIFNRPTSLSQKFINQTAVPDSTEK